MTAVLTKRFQVRVGTVVTWPKKLAQVSHKPYLEGQGDLVSRLITPITHIVTLIIPTMNLFTKFP